MDNTVQSHQYGYKTECVNKQHIKNLIVVTSEYIVRYSLYNTMSCDSTSQNIYYQRITHI